MLRQEASLGRSCCFCDKLSEPFLLLLLHLRGPCAAPIPMGSASPAFCLVLLIHFGFCTASPVTLV